MRFFGPPIGRSTFYNLVRRGVIVKIKEVQGYYLLNESLVRLGLPHMSGLPATPDAARRERQLVELALYLAAPDVVPEPSWMLTDDRLTAHEKSHVVLLGRNTSPATRRPRILGFGFGFITVQYGHGESVGQGVKGARD